MIMCVYPYFVALDDEFNPTKVTYEDKYLNEDRKKCTLNFLDRNPQERALICLRDPDEHRNIKTGRHWWNTFDDIYHKGSAITNVFIPPNTPQEMIVQKIIAAKPAGKQLTTLKLVSHGNTGMLALSGPKGSPLTFANAEPWADLKPHFNRPSAVIHLHGCGVASDTSVVGGGTIDNPDSVPGQWLGGTGLGYDLMSRLAYLTGVPVQAALDVQIYLYTKNPGSQDPFKGKNVYVTPEGDAWLSWEQRWVRPPRPRWERMIEARK
jgi:hypothetical protein